MLTLLGRRHEQAVSVEPITGLPLYLNSKAVSWERDKHKTIADQAGVTALRWIRFAPIGFHTVKSALQASDKLFQAVAEHCGAQVPEHTWGFAKPPYTYPRMNEYDDYYRFSNPLLPRGLQMVADTEIIRDIQPLRGDAARAINAGMAAYNRADPELQWYDEGTRQFGIGTSAKTGEEAIWLLDFEPFVRMA